MKRRDSSKFFVSCANSVCRLFASKSYKPNETRPQIASWNERQMFKLIDTNKLQLVVIRNFRIFYTLWFGNTCSYFRGLIYAPRWTKKFPMNILHTIVSELWTIEKNVKNSTYNFKSSLYLFSKCTVENQNDDFRIKRNVVPHSKPMWSNFCFLVACLWRPIETFDSILFSISSRSQFLNFVQYIVDISRMHNRFQTVSKSKCRRTRWLLSVFVTRKLMNISPPEIWTFESPCTMCTTSGSISQFHEILLKIKSRARMLHYSSMVGVTTKKKKKKKWKKH